MTLPALYTLATQYRALLALDIEDIDEQTLIDTIQGLEGDLQIKSQNVAAYCLNIQALADAANNAAKQMKDRANAIQRKADSLKSYIKLCMDSATISRIESTEFALVIKKNPPSVVIYDESKIPPELFTTPAPPAPYPNKTLIAQKLKQGEAVEGAHLQQTTRLEIK